MVRAPIPDDGSPAYDLAAWMSAASQEAWCASWFAPLETELWEVLTGERDNARWGNSVTDETLAEVRRCVREAGGWCGWDDRFGEYFIPMADWLALGHKPLPGGPTAPVG